MFISCRYGLRIRSFRTQIRDASTKPALRAKWFHCIDVPLSKPEWFAYKQEKEPEKFVPFSDYDGKRLEKAFRTGDKIVEVKEDRLFQVDVKKFCLSPVFWEGPVYEVRRGTWFDKNGVPLRADIADKIESAYSQNQPYEESQKLRRDSVKNSKKLPKDAVAKYNAAIKKELTEEYLDFTKEPDTVDLGDGKAVLFFDDKHAALFPSTISPFQLSVIRNIGNKSGSLLEVTPIQRGFTDDLTSSILDSIKSPPVPSISDIFLNEIYSLFTSLKDDKSSLLGETDDSDKQEMLQSVMKADYEDVEDPDASKRQVDHLVLCVHGIGQILGFKYESVNFTHSVNVFRNVMRDTYQSEEKYQKLAHGEDFDPKNPQHKHNNRIQLLPVSWRHRISFNPRKPYPEDSEDDARLPSLTEINVDGVKALRNIVGDVVLDVLLYYEPRYLLEIFKIVVLELNRVYDLYMERNPDFKGKVHLLGHSLGSAIAFDLLSIQAEHPRGEEYDLKFDVDNLFCIGSPLGMFKLLQRKNIVPRESAPHDFDPTDINLDFASPKCKNLFNVFHPSDPVSYRMEPLVKPEYARMKAEEVPYATQGINTQVRSLTNLGDDINQKLFSNWFKKEKVPQNTHASPEAKASQENALGDIFSTLAAPGVEHESDETKQEKMAKEDVSLLTQLNRTGRVDYALPVSVFSIALVSAISAHVSYFEDEDTAAFVMKMILESDRKPVETKKVEVYK